MKKSNYIMTIFLALSISMFFQELIFHSFAFKSVFHIEIIRIMFFVITTSLLLTFIFLLFSKKTIKILVCLTTFLLGTYSIVQLGFKNFMGNFVSFNEAGGELGRVSEFIGDFLRYIKPGYLIILLPFIILVILCLLEKSPIKRIKFNIMKYILLIILIVISNFIAKSTLTMKIFHNSDVSQDYKELYNNPNFPELALKEFGTTRFLFRDILSMFHSTKGRIINVDSGDKNSSVDKNYARNIDDTKWEEMIDKETNSDIVDLHNYFINQSITPKNDMTGYFKDKNFILIMVEAFDMAAIDEQLTPTLYKMANEGWYFNNHYSPAYSCATGDSEYIALTSIVPNPTICVPNEYKYNNYDASMFAIFNKSKYYSTSYHSFIDKYYDRKILHKSLGSVYFYNRDDLKIEKVLGWPSDQRLMEESIPHFIDQDKFFSFIITASTHFPYDIDSTTTIKYWNLVKDLPYSIKIKRYMAKAIDLDKSLEYLLNKLKESNKLDNTVIALFGDHHPLKMEISYLNEKSNVDRSKDFNVDMTPFIIYNSKVSPKKVETVNSTFDILPTIANLFDLKYDPRYYAGKDIFSKDQHIVIFPNSSWISDDGMYVSSKGEFTKTIDKEIDKDYAEKTNQWVKNAFNVYDQVLITNYFKYRFATK